MKPHHNEKLKELVYSPPIGTLIYLKISKTFDLRPLSARLAGIPEISIYSLQEHCLLAQYHLSIVTSPSDSLVYTFQVTYILVSRVQESLTLAQMDHFLSQRCQWDKSMLSDWSLFNFIRDGSSVSIITNFKKALLNFYY